MRLELLNDSRLEAGREFVPIKRLGTGSFGTVFVADWHSPLPSGTMVPAMQHSYARPEYVGKRIVAIKRMIRPYSTLEDCLSLNELHALIALPPHENIIALYDVFRKPISQELYLVFECMEGNLFQLMKSRKGRPMAPGLIASIIQQSIAGIEHVHSQGFLHRDLKPENLLITTTGLGEYPLSKSQIDGTKQDVLVVVKVADFGLARKMEENATFTTYVSTRWYRAPEILLESQKYSSAVDLWALGAIIAEMVRLEPLFPGNNAMDQLQCICSVLGAPTNDMHLPLSNGSLWPAWLDVMQQWERSVQPLSPVSLERYFPFPTSDVLLDFIFHILRYDPADRLTARQCLQHPFLVNEAPKLRPTRRMIPEPTHHPPATALSYDTDSPYESDSVGSPEGALEAVRDTPPKSELHEHSDVMKRLNFAQGDNQYVLFPKSSLLHRSQVSPGSRSNSPLFFMHTRKKTQESTRSMTEAIAASPSACTMTPPTLRPKSEGFSDRRPSFFSERHESGHLSSGTLLRRGKKDPVEKETKEMERKRREDEKAKLRERSRAVVQNRVNMMQDQGLKTHSKRWVDIGL